MRRSERPMLLLPHQLVLGFIVLFACQVLYHHLSRQRLAISYQALATPLNAATYQSVAMGSEELLSYLLAMRLQLHDNQAGQHFRYRLIDYRVLVDWLEKITEINPRSEYPMLLASRVYSQTRDHTRLRQILGFIERRFDTDPQLHWRRLAEASVIAKHNLDDLDLALRLAAKLARQPHSIIMPHWARDIRFLLLADLNEFEAAIAIIEVLLQTGAVDDPDEKRFLEEKLSSFKQKLSEFRQSKQN